MIFGVALSSYIAPQKIKVSEESMTTSDGAVLWNTFCRLRSTSLHGKVTDNIGTKHLIWSRLLLSTLITGKLLLWLIVPFLPLLNQCNKKAFRTNIYSAFIKYQIYSCIHGKFHQSRWACNFSEPRIKQSCTQVHLLWSWVPHVK